MASAEFAIREPSSFDPLKHDLLAHHVTQRSVLSPLVSVYKKGSTIGIIAEKWRVSDDEKTWTFNIRKNLTFSNQEKIDALAVKRSFTRMAFKKKQMNSKSGLLEYIEGFDALTSPNSEFSGIVVTDSYTLEFRLSRKVSEFLYKIGFGIYSIVSPSDFDAETGDWLDSRKVTASGPYKLIEFKDNQIIVEKRTDFPYEIFPNEKFQVVTFFWKNHPENSTRFAHIYLGDSLSEPEANGTQFDFSGSIKNGISYVKLVGWQHSKNLSSEKQFRIDLRSKFYSALQKLNRKPVLSFLPLDIKGAQEASLGLPASHSSQYTDTFRILSPQMSGDWHNDIRSAMESAAKELGLKVEHVAWSPQNWAAHYDNFRSNYAFDAVFPATGIAVEAPIDDLKFMVQSKQGVNLPDPTGRLHELTEKDAFSVQEMNEVLWNDAIIWPITHFAVGLWYDPEKIDVSLISDALPPTELALIQPR